MLHLATTFHYEQPVSPSLRRLLLKQEQMLDALVLRARYHNYELWTMNYGLFGPSSVGIDA